MREIKFRLRDKDNKIIGYEIWNSDMSRWQYIFTKGNSMGTTCPVCHQTTALESLEFLNRIKYKDSFTGFHDKNGKEIYEGDILSNAPQKIEVRWDSIFGRWFGHYLDNRGTSYFWMGNEFKNYEVIGNIYENPELMKELK